MPTVRRSIERPPADLVSELAAFGSAMLSDAPGRTGTMHARIRSVGRRAGVAGPACTVRVYPNDNLMCHVAVTVAEPGDVLVIDGGNYAGAALWGEMLTRAAMSRGITGAIVDGAARDVDAIGQLGFPVHASAVVPRGTHKRHAGDINLPISCGELLVDPGDIVVGDTDGVTVVPRARALATLAQAKVLAARERGWRDALEAGMSPAEVMPIDPLIADAGIVWE